MVSLQYYTYLIPFYKQGTQYAYFTRHPLTQPAQEVANTVDALQVSPQMMEQDILRWMESAED